METTTEQQGYKLSDNTDQTQDIEAILDYILATDKATQADQPWQDLAAFLAEPEPPHEDLWQVEGLIVRNGLTLLLGAEKSMKSIAAAQLAVASATPGGQWLGSTARSAQPWLIEEEGTRHGWRNRMGKIRALFPDWDSTQHPVRFSLRQGFDLLSRDSLRFLVRGIVLDGHDLVIAGPISMVTSIIDENKSDEWKRLGRILQRLCARTGVTIVLIHHSRKPGENGPSTVRSFFNTARGSNALTGMVDSAIGIQKEEEDDHGYLWNMQREDSKVPPKQFFTVNRDTLLFQITEKEQHVTAQKLSKVEEVLYDHARITYADFERLAKMRSNTTARRHLDTAVDAGIARRLTGPKGNSPHRFDLTHERRAEIARSRGEAPADTDDLEFLQPHLLVVGNDD